MATIFNIDDETISTIDDWVDSMAIIADADTYLSYRGVADWVDSTDDDPKNQALQRAWDWLSGLDWFDGVFDDGLPDKIKYAQILAAYQEWLNPNCLNPVLTPDDYLLEKNIAGVLVKTYRQNSPVKNRYLQIESLLKPYLRNSSSNAAVELLRG